MRRGRGLALVAGLLMVRSAAAGTATLRADRLEVLDGVASGEGNVRFELDDQRATGQRFSYDLSSGRLVVYSGSWTRPEGTLSFSRAEIDVGQGQGIVLDGEYHGQDGRLVVRGDQLAWEGEGQLSGERVYFTTCACDRPPWAVESREVRVTLDDTARFQGGWIALCDHRIVPVPRGSFPLVDRRSGLLLPRLGYGDDGLVLGLPVYLTLGPAADLTATPELRSARSVRALGELRYALPGKQGGQIVGAGGWDLQTASPRGALGWDHAQAGRRAVLASDVLLWSDPDYGSDYGDGFLARHAPWTESRLLGGLGPLWITSDLFQNDEMLGQRPLGVALSGTRPLGPLALRLGAGVDAFAEGSGPLALEQAQARATAAARLSGGHDWSILRLEGQIEARATDWLDGEPWGQGRGVLRAVVPMWARSGSGYLLLDPGLEADGAWTVGALDQREPDDATDPPWQLGPSLAFKRISSAGVPISGALALPWTPDGPRPEGWLRLAAGDWSARGGADLDLQEGDLSWDDGKAKISLGAARSAALLEAVGGAELQLPGRLSAWRPSWSGLVDIRDGELLSQRAALRYKPACDCLDATLSAALSQDRVLPELGLTLSVW